MSLKTSLKRTSKTKKYAFIVSVILIITIAVGGTVAWISTGKDAKENFSVPEVKCEVLEDINGVNKENVSVKNIGYIDEYIRVALVMSWEDDNGNTVAREIKPSDYTMSLNKTNWFKGSDGYYYFTKKVAQGDKTKNLINKCVVNNTTSGYNFKLEVVASAIQATPNDAVEQAWGAVKVDVNGNLINS